MRCVLQNMVNISVTSSDNPDKVRNALVTVFMQQNMKYEASGFVSTFSDNLEMNLLLFWNNFLLSEALII